MKKKICFVNTNTSWGGGEKWHYEVATNLSEAEKYSISFIINPQSVLLQKIRKNSKINCFEKKVSNLSFLNLFKLFSTVSFFRKQKINTVIINQPSDLKLIAIVSLFVRKLKIIYRRGSAIPIKNTIFNKFLLLNIVDLIIANSLATKKTIMQNFKNNTKLEHKIKVIYNGININKYEVNQENSRSKSDEIILGSLGRMVKQKNQLFLLKIAEKLKQEKIKFKMLIAGDGKLREKIENKIFAKKLEHFVELPGKISNVKQFYNSIDIFLLPSLWEGFGFVIAEASICEKPTIAFNLSSNPELIKNNVSGFLIDKNDAKQFVEKIILLNKNQQKIKEFGKNAKKNILQNFKFNDKIKELEKFI